MLELVRKTLKKDERLTADGKLLKNKIMELTYKQDEKLVELIMSEDKLKDYFFTEVNSALIFDKDKFVKFINNKNFLPDSYTTFKNKIGLTDNGENYLSRKKDVSLVWPYKDCILEGDQADPDEERKEIFWNETLAHDEIDRLTEPKVFADFKRVDEQGEHEEPIFNNDDNLLLKGNNLLALHSLVDKYRNKVKLIYLDPPYNTGRDSFNYNDKFNRSTWLTFIKNRITVAKEFLKDSGVLVVQCDDNEQAYLKVLLDEIFGEDNFVNAVSVKMSNLSGPKMSHVDKKLPKLKEYLLIYKVGDSFSYNPVKTEIKDWNPEYNRFLTNFTKEDYKVVKSYQNSDDVSISDIEELNEILEGTRIKNVKEVIQKKNINNVKKWKKENAYRIIRKHSGPDFKRKAEEREIYKYDQEVCAFKAGNSVYLSISDYNREAQEPRMQIVFAKDHLKKPAGDMWLDINTSGFQNQGGVKLKNGKKPEELIKRIISLTTNRKDLVLDFFLGSGTTAAVAHKMERQYIGIEQLDYGENDPFIRLKNVINGDATGVSKEVEWEGGGNFIYTELMEVNEKYIKKIKNADKDNEFVDIWNDMKKEAFLSYKVDPKEIDENINEFKNLQFENKKKFLFECLDKNHLYVNFSEIEDEKYDISENIIELNKQFYGVDL